MVEAHNTVGLKYVGKVIVCINCVSVKMVAGSVKKVRLFGPRIYIYDIFAHYILVHSSLIVHFCVRQPIYTFMDRVSGSREH